VTRRPCLLLGQRELARPSGAAGLAAWAGRFSTEAFVRELREVIAVVATSGG
jgi:hypothetical protein